VRVTRIAAGGLVVASALFLGVAAGGATTGASVTLVAGGDLSLSRYIGNTIRSRGDPKYPIRGIAPRFAAADIAFANLEAPFSDVGPVTPARDTLTFKNEPGTVTALTAMGLDVVSGANNHFWNAGAHGVLYSADLLTQNGILLAGAGADDAAAHAPRVLTRRGVRFAFLAYGYPDDSTVATATRPGIATAADIPRMQSDVRKAKGRADVVIVSLHAGTEYTRTPTAFQRRFNRAAIDAGAAVVLGHHPHWVQRMERYRRGVILYSLGNLVFDQPWSWETRHGAVATVTFVGSKLKRVRLTPVEIVGGVQPRFTTGSAADAVITRLGILDSDIRFR
jgi:poly-gamma-glutamate synthesis protein (capsule biosynthesis protein)